ncbi:beta-microseminoprotein [Carettochelys insculpta]|uniref:beta-microseminoprotein n=1 Tax=Carettochelys insculpta TaxID=44489 RepID=UPI003EBC77AD
MGAKAEGSASYGHPTGFDEKKCDLAFNKDSCSYSVVEKDNPSKNCEFTGMKCFLGFLLVCLLSTSSCDAQCYAEKVSPKAKGCIDKQGTLHNFNAKWRTKDCFQCTCSKESINCCSLFAVPLLYDQKKCQRIFNPLTCRYTVVEKADPSKPCKVHGWVG